MSERMRRIEVKMIPAMIEEVRDQVHTEQLKEEKKKVTKRSKKKAEQPDEG